MKKNLFTLCALVCATLVLAAPKDDRYNSLQGRSGEDLFKALSTVANSGYHTLGYDGLWTAYKETDLYPSGHPLAGKIWDMYGECDNFTFKSKQCGSYGGECDCYNREHSIPKSWFGGSTSGIGCDIFHLVPTDGKVNNARSNYAFGEVGSKTTYTYNGNKLGTSNFSGYSGTVFEPIDEYKGDFARGYFGTICKWLNKSMTTGDGKVMFTNNYTDAGGYGLTTYSINLLMKWHREDPVSEKEIARNDGIEKTQGNRNPFIDYPYLAEYFWGKMKGKSVDLACLMSAYDPEFVPGKSDGSRERTDIGLIYNDEVEQHTIYTLQGQLGVFTIMGQYVTTTTSEQIEAVTENLPAGIYVVRSSKESVKFVKD